MNRPDESRVITENVAAHPAAKAWKQLGAAGPALQRLEVIRPMDRNKTPIFKLPEAGHEGKDVIAKKSSHAAALIEDRVYRHVLPRMAQPGFHYYGMVEADENTTWVFVEDVGGEPFSFENPQHRAIATEWLAELHTRVPHLEDLPGREPEYCFSRLNRGGDRIRQYLAEAAPDTLNRRILESLLEHVDILNRREDRINTLYRELPKGFIHGDFKHKNIRVRRVRGQCALMVFDWEDSGWGCPGVDMWQMDPHSYRSMVQQRWSGFTLEQAQQLVSLGRLLWCSTAVYWSSGWLLHEWTGNAISRVGIYDRLLAESLDQLAAYL